MSFGLSILQKPDDWQWHREHDVFWMRTANEDKMTTYEMGSSSFSRGRNHIHHTNLMWGMFEQYSNVLRWRVQFPTLFNRCEFRKECNNHNPVWFIFVIKLLSYTCVCVNIYTYTYIYIYQPLKGPAFSHIPIDMYMYFVYIHHLYISLYIPWFILIHVYPTWLLSTTTHSLKLASHTPGILQKKSCLTTLESSVFMC